MRKRSGYLKVDGKRNKYRERTCPHLVPLNATVRKVLLEYLTTVKGDWPFISRKTKSAITTTQRDRVASLAKQDDGTFVPSLGYLVAKYARIAGVEDISPHDLRHRFGYRMAETVPLHRLAQIMGHDSDTVGEFKNRPIRRSPNSQNLIILCEYK